VERSFAASWRPLRRSYVRQCMPFGLPGNSSTAQPHSDLLGFPKPPLMSRFLLARVGKPIAVAAGEQAPGTVQLGDAATAINSVCSHRTHKPWPLATETARRPGDGDPLLNIAPVLAIRAASVFQRHGMALGFDDLRAMRARVALAQDQVPAAKRAASWSIHPRSRYRAQLVLSRAGYLMPAPE
jgi:hypothetical protein